MPPGGMGGSSLAPEALRRTFKAESFHVLDTTHPKAIRSLEQKLDLDKTLFLVSSKSGSTLETRSHMDYFWEQVGDGSRFAAVTDPGSDLERVAGERDFRARFPGEPTIGGRYSALSMFGLVPAALMGVDLERYLVRTAEMVEACRLDDGNPGLELGERLGTGWREGARQGADQPEPRRLWALGRAADCGVDGQAGKGSRARSR